MKKWFAFATTALLIVIDQLIKDWALTILAPVGQIQVIPRLFYLTYVENRGAAFGIFQGKTIVLVVITGLLLLGIVCIVMFGAVKSNFLVWMICIGLGGGIGNLYDRIARGFVVDYLDFSALFGFAVFNFADCCIVVSTIFVLIYFLKADIAEKRKSPELKGL